MPTIQKASLDHTPFDWRKDFDSIRAALEQNRMNIFRLTGFDAEYRALPEKRTEEGNLLLDEIAGYLAWAGSIRVDAGFKPATHVIATLKAIKRDKTMINYRRQTIEPEALGILELAYKKLFKKIQLPDHPPAHKLDAAVDEAIKMLAPQKHRGGKIDIATQKLAADLQGIFGRFGTNVARTVARGEDKRKQGGRFTKFLQIIIPPLNELMAQKGAKGFSIRTLARLAASVSGGSN